MEFEKSRENSILYPRRFEYFSPRTLREASHLLKKYKGEAKVLAGGHSLIPLMKLRLASPKYVVDINRIEGLDFVKRTKNYLRIGALTRYYELEDSDLIRESCPILLEAVQTIGDTQVRSRGTLGGNLSHADPANDLPVVMLALDATYIVKGLGEQRVIKASEFYTDLFTTKLRSGEILIEARVPIIYSPFSASQSSAGSFQKFERRTGDFAIVSVALQIAVDEEGICNYAGIGLGAVGPTPIKAREAEKLLVGKRITADRILAVAEKCKEISNPMSDLSGSVEYKKEMVKVFVSRALNQAKQRIGL
jgi:carbon-monoxide dehydrogenase medium subunit